LDLEGRWPLAADVFQSVADIFPDRKYPRIVIEASTALGAAARNSGDWVTSSRAYARAEHLAHTIRDDELALVAQIGMAGSQMVQGNLPAADADLSVILGEADRLSLPVVRALALHSRASVAHLRGDYQQAIHLAYRSLELTTNATARERVLADIAAAYAGLGMKKTARDGYSIVAMTSPHQWVRWQATLNLIELCVEEGDEPAFNSYMQQLDLSALDPRLRAYALFFQAMGTRRFGTGDFTAQLECARDYAEQNRLHQIAFQIQDVMDEPLPLSTIDAPISGPNVPLSDELTRIAEELGHLRERASA
jgi:tetratricopeptide (TPR) repeat protein